ncbi:preprotein translocase subunit SecF [Halorubrum distributum JCM 13561]|uniref:Protein-export membrane protein SecF n=1 Tax=Halorubrum distributum JCM 13561 TaxID=1227483 RepID=M0NLV8_9EURY|nr:MULTISPECIES: protein translocase subunit SecF [Halorubrum distributum group]EMA58796.1 preprotein translocase subunit SecF [Halorubrum litoreum JCM 13561]MDV7349176.1 protein translocase subunit SecF [Halorubrum distributum]OYR79417.1 preprotein translocase subunit SecF [Halorubrum distributum]
MVAIEVPEVNYTDYSNRQLAAVPLAFLVLALAIIGGWVVATGAPANMGLEFTGGVELRVAADGGDVEQQVQTAFDREPDSVRTILSDDVDEGRVVVVTFQATENDPEGFASNLQDQADAAGFTTLAVDQVSASFASDTARTALFGVALAFLGMSVLVFALFRTFVPSLAVVASAFSDLVIPIAAMNLLGIEMTLGTIAALLMIIGYSVDSDILLNDSVLRRTGEFYESVSRAMRTGVTMTLTSIAAMVVMAIVASVFGVGLLRDIGIILSIGLCADLMNTYLLNVSLLRWYKFEGVAR